MGPMPLFFAKKLGQCSRCPQVNDSQFRVGLYGQPRLEYSLAQFVVLIRLNRFVKTSYTPKDVLRHDQVPSGNIRDISFLAILPVTGPDSPHPCSVPWNSIMGPTYASIVVARNLTY